MNPTDMTILSKADLLPDGDVAEAAMKRANIISLSQAAEDAVLRPKDFGAFEHDLRAALAARVARLSADDTLAAHYLSSAGDKAIFADPEETGKTHQLDTVLAFVDKVANHTRDIEADDVAQLQASGVADADIVRLCELVAFLAYQVRVIAGLRLLQRSAA
ncbi:hypothetical protein [Pararhizobium sp. IMCC21322]|uniref:hypothetical protein n=1 Tax=Pararhizobium sp. IMCC21322 TaxID=3067903 RepID=UPI0027429877|nr:hypothetical protein [Pararhizobium sp. IMCC21322]